MKSNEETTALAIAGITPETILQQGQFAFHHVSEKGILFDPETPYEAWEPCVTALTTVYERSGHDHAKAMFMLGDALAFGEAKYGEDHAQAIDLTREHMRLSEKTLTNLIWVSKNVAPSLRRVDTLTLAHHSEVAKLSPDEQKELLTKCADENLPVSDLKKIVKERHPKTSKGKERAPSPKKVIIDLESEEGLAHAAEKIAEWFQAEEKEIKTDKKRLRLKDWPINRKNLWMSLAELARIARNMGLTGQDKGRHG